MENIHPNHNPVSKSLMLWSNTNANFRYYHISLIMHMWRQINNISRYSGNHDLISPDHGKHPSESSGTLLMHLSESRVRKNNVLFHKLQAAGISVVTESLFGFTKLILHHPRAVTAASRGSTIADLALRITHQPKPYILWSRFTCTLPCLTLISTVRALVCATATPVRSSAKTSAILNESVTAVTASRFFPVRRVGVWSLPWRWHILSIPLTTGRGTGAETCGLDGVFPPDDLCSRPEPEALC